MPDHVYRIIEVAGSSEKSIEEAIQNAVSRASRTLRQVGWFEVVQTRGHVEEGNVAHYQVILKVGFTLKDCCTSIALDYRRRFGVRRISRPASAETHPAIQNVLLKAERKLSAGDSVSRAWKMRVSNVAPVTVPSDRLSIAMLPAIPRFSRGSVRNTISKYATWKRPTPNP